MDIQIQSTLWPKYWQTHLEILLLGLLVLRKTIYHFGSFIREKLK